MMNEKVLEEKLRLKVKELGGIAVKMPGLTFTGMPDRIVLMPGARIWFAEVKSTGKKPDQRQLIVHEMLKKLGFEVWVIDTNDLLNDFFKTITC